MKPAPRVSLCMIVKDEEDSLPGCLESVAGVVDEIVVYDTGSTDRTVEIAEATGATVLRGYWDDDFGRARNAALAACTGEWILHLDADEAIEFDRATLHRGLARATGIDVLLLEIRNVGARGGEYRHTNRRLFRRTRCHWVGRLHERVETRDGRPLTDANLAGCSIVHWGYAEDVIAHRGKGERNIRIAEAELAAAGPDDDRGALLINVARSYSSHGDNDTALDRFAEARDVRTSAHRATALRLGVELLLDRCAFDEAREWIDELDQLGNEPTMVEFLRGSVDLLEGRPADALADLAHLDGIMASDGMGVPERQFRLRIAMALAACGRWEDAAVALRRSLDDDPTANLWGLLATCLHQSGADPAPDVDAIPGEHLRTVLAQVLREPVDTGEAFGRVVRERFEGDARLVAFAVHHGPRLDDLEAALPWATIVRDGGLAERCPLIARAEDPAVAVPERFMAALVAHAAFRDERALPLLHDLSERLSPEDEPGAVHALCELAPELVSAE